MKPCCCDLGQRLDQLPADHVAAADELAIGGIGQLEHVVRSAQHGHEARRLLELLFQRSRMVAQPLARQMLLGHIGADHQHAADAALFVDRAVAIGPPHVLAPAVAVDRHQRFLVPGGALAGHHQSICGPMMSQMSAQRLAAAHARAPRGCISGPIVWL